MSSFLSRAIVKKDWRKAKERVDNALFKLEIDRSRHLCENKRTILSA